MTTIGMFTIYDSKAEAYLQPFFSINIETAKREFTKHINGDTPFNEFPEDYALFYLGDFDQEEGKFTLQITPQHVSNAVKLKAGSEQLLLPMTNQQPITKETSRDV